MNIGRTVKSMAQSKGMSLRYLAEQADLSEAIVYSWTQKNEAKRRNPTPENILRVAHVLGVTPDEIFYPEGKTGVAPHVYAKWCVNCPFKRHAEEVGR